MSYYKVVQGSTKCLTSFQCLVHTTTVKKRTKDLKGLAAYVIPCTDVSFDIPDALWNSYKYCSRTVDAVKIDAKLQEHFDKLFERHENTWLRALHNPNIAFTDPSDGWYGKPDASSKRMLVAKYFISTLNKAGYTLKRGMVR